MDGSPASERTDHDEDQQHQASREAFAAYLSRATTPVGRRVPTDKVVVLDYALVDQIGRLVLHHSYAHGLSKNPGDGTTELCQVHMFEQQDGSLAIHPVVDMGYVGKVMCPPWAWLSGPDEPFHHADIIYEASLSFFAQQEMDVRRARHNREMQKSLPGRQEALGLGDANNIHLCYLLTKSINCLHVLLHSPDLQSIAPVFHTDWTACLFVAAPSLTDTTTYYIYGLRKNKDIVVQLPSLLNTIKKNLRISSSQDLRLHISDPDLSPAPIESAWLSAGGSLHQPGRMGLFRPAKKASPLTVH